MLHLLDIEHLQAVMREDLGECRERVIAEVLVVDRVELIEPQQVQHVMEFERRHPGRLEQYLEAGNEVVDVRNVRDHVVGRHQVGAYAFRGECLGRVAPKKAYDYGYVLGGSARSDVGGWLNP